MSVSTASSLRSRRHRPLLLGAMVGLLLAVTGLAGGSLPVSAHTSFGSSNPADGAVIAEPVSEIVLGFTNVSEEAGDGFVVLDSTGQVREPISVTTADGKTFRLAFDPALSDGRVAVRWSVRAGDAHPISGSFSFTVGATAAAASDDMSGMSAEEMAAMSASEMPAMTAEEMAAMDEFLQVDDSRPGESIARFGRIIALSAIVLAIGVLVFGATTLFGSRREIGALVTAVRGTGAALAVGATIEYLGVSRIAGDALTSAWSSSAGLAAAMRIVGGIAIAVGLAASTTLIKSARPARSLSSAVNASPPRVDTSFWGDEPIPASTSARRSVVDRDNGGFFDPGLAFAERPAGPTPTRSRVNPDDGNEPSRRRVVTARRAASSTAVADRDGAAVIPTADIDHGEMCRWRADRASWLAFAGVAVAVVSFWFDGHTVTKGFRAPPCRCQQRARRCRIGVGGRCRRDGRGAVEPVPSQPAHRRARTGRAVLERCECCARSGRRGRRHHGDRGSRLVR
jgi:methionine-rich copper-binding protein CopC